MATNPLDFLNRQGTQLGLDVERPETSPLDFLNQGLTGFEAGDPGAAIRGTLSKNPDQAARERAAAAALGTSPEAVATDPALGERLARERSVEEMLRDTPGTRQFMSDPANAEIAHDDVENLTAIERAWQFGWNALKRGGYRTAAGANQFLAEQAVERAEDSERSYGEILRSTMSPAAVVPGPVEVVEAGIRFVTSRLSSLFEDDREVAEMRLSEVSRLRQRVSEIDMSPSAQAAMNAINEGGRTGGLLGALQAAASDPFGALVLGLEVGLESAPQVAAGAAATAITRTPQVGAGIMGALSGLTERFNSPAEFLEARGIDLSDPTQIARVVRDEKLMREAADFGFARGAIIGAFDALAGGLAAERFGGLLRNIVAQAGIQATAGGGGELMAQLSTEGDVEWGDVVIEMLGELATAAPEVIGVGGYYFRNDRERAEKGEAGKKALDEVKKAAAQSVLPQRSPEAAAQHQSEAMRAAGFEPSVIVRAQAVADFAQNAGLDPQQLYENLGVADQMPEALLLGGDVRVRAPLFARHVLQDDAAYQAVSDHVRVTEDAMTAAEAEEFKKTGLADEAERLGVQAEEAAPTEAPEQVPASRDAEIPAAVSTFRTSRGSTYQVHADGTTTRDKAARPEHPGEAGPQPKSDLTVYVDPKVAQALALPEGEARIVDHGDGTLSVAVKNADGQWGISPSARNVPVTAVPEAGKSPVELWDRETVNGRPAYRRIHLGNVISEVDRGVTPTPLAEPEVEAAVTLAEAEMGLQGLFRTAQEAGLTDAQYQTYLASLQRAAESGRRRQEEKRLRRELRQATDEWKAELTTVREEMREAVSLQPVYAAINAIGRERLDRQRVIELLPDGERQLDQLPTQDRGRHIYEDRGARGGVDPDYLAQLYDFPDGQTMLFAMMDAPKMGDAIEQASQRVMLERHPELLQRRNALREAIEAVHTDRYAEVLAFELNQLREARGQGRLRPALLRRVAQDRIRGHQIKDIRPDRYLQQERREARNAARLLRKGDRRGAAEAKFRQLLNFQYAKETFQLRQQIDRQHKFLSRFLKTRAKFPSLPADYFDMIVDLLSRYNLGSRVSMRAPKDAFQFARQKTADGVPVEITDAVAAGGKNFRDLTLAEWEALHASVRQLYHQGTTEQKFLLETEKRERDAVVGGVIEQVRANLRPRERIVGQRTKWQAAKKYGREYLTTVLNADSILREIDGFAELGPAYRAIKGGIDRAISRGYQPGQIGYVPRQRREGERLVRLYRSYQKSERLGFNRKRDIPGVGARLSKNEELAVLLNLGNSDGVAALIESGQFTAEELDAIVANAGKRDLDFAQAVWDYLGEFWPEIDAAVRRRTGRSPEKVEAMALSTPHGNYRGGYYPLKYDRDKSLITSHSDVDEMMEQMLYGHFAMSHTRDGHTRARVGSGGQKVMLSLFVLNQHVDQVIYDLEVGDAVRDAYKVLHSRRLKDAISEIGHNEKWEALDLWLGDVATSEIRTGGWLEGSLRWLRTGFTVSKLAWNVGVVALQPLGIIQSAVQIGKPAMAQGLRIMLGSPLIGPNNIFSAVANESTVMAAREDSFHKDIIDASRQLRSSLLARALPGDTADFLTASLFFGIKKTQRFVDTWTYLGAKHRGMELFNGDERRAIEYAERMVIRSQASGLFPERTAAERGSFGKLRQTELIRAFTALISYFMAKTNVAYERTRKTDFRNPAQVVGWAADMVLLYGVEAVLAGLIRGQWPDEDDDDEPWWQWALGETANTVLAGFPMIREFASAANGFTGGGIPATVAADFGRLAEQVGQGEFDEALLKSANNLGGILLKYPASQINKTGSAIWRAGEGEEVEWWEFILGPKFDG